MTERVEIGNAVLYHGDCLEILPTLAKVDAVVTDPPYGLGIAANPVRQKHEKLDWDNAPASEAQITALLKYGDHQCIWGGNYFDLPPSQGFLVWDKCQPDGLTLAQVEYAWISKKQPAKLFTRRVIGYAKDHPTQKPVELMEWCIRQLGNPAVVLDPFMGSGTTGVACANLGRKFIGIEIEERYFQIACERIDAAYRQQRLFSDEPVTRPEASGFPGM